MSYLLNMPLSRLIAEEVEKLQSQVELSRAKLNKVIQTSWQDSWLADLLALEKVGKTTENVKHRTPMTDPFT